MQEILPFVMQARPHYYPELKIIAKALKKAVLGVWTAIRCVLEVLFTPPPGQKYIEESRDRAIRLIGHF